jgi:hypothetical protein
MPPEMETPPWQGRRSRMIFASSSEQSDSTTASTNQPSWQEAWLAARFRLAKPWPRVIAQAAGIGGGE